MMFPQKKPTTSATAQKLHSIHALPDGTAFTGKIRIGKANYQFTFAPKTAEVSSARLKLKGVVAVTSPTGQKRAVENVEATLLSTQGNIQPGPSIPRTFPDSLRPPEPEAARLPVTDATDHFGSIGVMYFKLSAMDGRNLGVPMDLSAVQLNARVYPQSELERDLQWLYSAWLLAAHTGNEQVSKGYLAEINDRLKS
jgi:hypothetical protein